MTGEMLLDVRDLRVSFKTGGGALEAVSGVTFQLKRGEVLSIVGESGSGKSVALKAIMRLLPATAQISGSAQFDGADLFAMTEREMRRVRGGRIAMIFQDPLTAFNPVQRIGDQIAEMVHLHNRHLNRTQLRKRSIELLELVAIPDAASRVDRYPHEFSGGMRQRAMIAMALANDPEVLVADEPTTALDVTVQAQILDVLRGLQRELDIGLVLVTHDLGVVANIADRVAVMYAGRLVETGSVEDLFADPRHPYTLGLIASVPRIDRLDGRLTPIPGSPPALLNRPAGCAFAPRCPMAQEICGSEQPMPRPVGRTVAACHFADQTVVEIGAG